MLKKADRYLIQLLAFIMLIASIVLLSSCKKSLEDGTSCKCGEVLYKEQSYHVQTGTLIYGVRAINNCSGNDTLVEVSQSQYDALSKGEAHCLSVIW